MIINKLLFCKTTNLAEGKVLSQPGCRKAEHILGEVQYQGEGVHHILQEGVVHIQVEMVGVGNVLQLAEEAFELV